MKNKKLLSSMLAMSMLFVSTQSIFGTAVSAYDYASLTQNTVTSADSDGVFWIEETAYSSFNSNTQDGSTGRSETPASVSNEMWSGGAAYYDCFAGRYHDAEYKINAAAAGTYKIWYHGSDPTSEYSDKSKLYVNGNLVSLTGVSGTSVNGTTGNGKTLACAWFTGTVSLVGGENTIRYLVDEKSTAKFDQYRYACIFDCLVLSPSNYEWTSPSISSKPTEPAITENSIEIDGTGAVKIEESDYTSFDSGTGETPALASDVGTVDTALFSGGEAHYLWFAGRTHDAIYSLNVTAAGTYKLWYHGSDPTNGYHDKSKILVNGVETEITVIPNTSSEIKLAASGKTISCVWAVAEITLESGSNTVEYLVNEKATTVSDQPRYTGLLDCFVVAPQAYEWTSPSIITEPTESTVTENPIDIDGTGAVKIEESDYTSFDSGTGEMPALASDVNTVDTMLLSGGEAHYVWFAGRTHDAVYSLNVTEAGTYKLWYHGSDPTNGYHDKSKILVNGVETSITVIPNTSSEIKLAASGKTISCVWAVAEITLSSGSNTIEYLIDEKATTVSDQPRYTGLLDCFVVAPQAYEWASPSISTEPEEASVPEYEIEIDGTEAVKIEESDYTSFDSGTAEAPALASDVSTVDTTLLSGGDAHYIWFTGRTHDAVYGLNVTAAGTYKLWYHGSDPTNGYHDKSKILVNGVEAVITVIPNTSSEIKLAASGKTISCVWAVAEITLESGGNTIEYLVDEKATTVSDQPRYTGLLDCFVVAPQAYEWSSPAIDTLPEEEEEFEPDFFLEGDMNVGDNIINASVYLNEKSSDMDATVYYVLHDSDYKIKSIGTEYKLFSQQSNRLDISLSLQAPVSEGDTFNVYIWDRENELKPLSPKLTLGNKFLLRSFYGEQSFHTPLMTEYLNDSYDSIADYADGTTSSDRPVSITFGWEWIARDAKPDSYTLSLSESPDMENPVEYTVSSKSCDVYNLKINTEYYWMVSAEDGSGNTVTSSIETIKTENKAPRNLFISGISNVRDVGGWNTSDGKQVKQGYLYRSFRLSYMDNGVFKRQISDGGISTMRNALGIKSEIDIRLEDEMPLEYTESVLGADVNYFREPMNYDGDYLASNKAAIQGVFEELSNPSNYPIVYHCSAGADRTAMVTYLINGLLGVGQEDLFRDYLLSNFANTDGRFRSVTNITDLYVKTIDEYRGDTLSEKIYNYLNEVIEVPTQQLDSIIGFLK